MTQEYDQIEWGLLPVPLHAFDYADAYSYNHGRPRSWTVHLFRRPGVNPWYHSIPHGEMGLENLDPDTAGRLVEQINAEIQARKNLGMIYRGPVPKM